MLEGFLGRWPFIWVVLQAERDELHGCLRDLGLLGCLLGEDWLVCLQNESLVEYLSLRYAVCERFLSVEHLEEDHSQGPHIDLGVDERSIVVEGFRRKVPISASALGGQLHPGLLAVLHYLAQPEV